MQCAGRAGAVAMVAVRRANLAGVRCAAGGAAPTASTSSFASARARQFLPDRSHAGPAFTRGFAAQAYSEQAPWWAGLRDTLSRAAAKVNEGLPPGLKRRPPPVRRRATSILPPPGSPPGTATRVLALHADAFWQAHGPKVLGVAAGAAAYGAWKLTAAGARALLLPAGETALSAPQALGAAAAAVGLVAAGAAAFRARYALPPDAVYRRALARLNADPGVLELLGAPVAGAPARAVVQTGGGLRLRGASAPGGGWWGVPLPTARPRRVHMVFPLAGPARRGLAAVEAKKRHGRIEFRVLAVDVPVERAGVPWGKGAPGGASAPASPYWEHRLFLEGDDAAYGRGHVFESLRAPFAQTLALRRAQDEEDDLDDAVDAAAVAAAERADRAAALLASEGQVPDGSAWWWLRRRWGSSSGGAAKS